MSRRLYHKDAYKTRFDAAVTAIVDVEGRAGVILEATHFYPESGGQPCDTGTLGGVGVDAVIERDDNVIHILAERPQFGPGDGVEGVIDWRRRFINMQQHTGQHILSQAFERVLDAPTVSSALGTEHSTIDVARLGLSWEEMARVEDLANNMVYENRPVEISEVSPDEAGAMRTKKTGRPAVRRRLLRIVEVSDFDRSPCGGTHTRRSGEVGHIKIIRWEKVRDATRVEFLCGLLAGRDYFWKNRFVVDLAQKMTTRDTNLPGLIDDLARESKSLRKEIAGLRADIAMYRLDELRAAAEEVGGKSIIAATFDDIGLPELRRVAFRAVEAGSTVALLCHKGEKVQFVFSRSDDIPVDMREPMKAACGVVGGRGGGRPEVAQGGGESADLSGEAMARALDLVRSRLADMG